MCQNDRIEYESKLADARSTDSLFKFYRSFKTSKTPTSMFYLNEHANDPGAQAELFSKYYASKFIKSRMRSILRRPANVDTAN